LEYSQEQEGELYKISLIENGIWKTEMFKIKWKTEMLTKILLTSYKLNQQNAYISSNITLIKKKSTLFS
jgi:hypothetical protein